NRSLIYQRARIDGDDVPASNRGRGQSVVSALTVVCEVFGCRVVDCGSQVGDHSRVRRGWSVVDCLGSCAAVDRDSVAVGNSARRGIAAIDVDGGDTDQADGRDAERIIAELAVEIDRLIVAEGDDAPVVDAKTVRAVEELKNDVVRAVG